MGSLDLHDVPPERRSGVALDHLVSHHRQHQREHRRPRALTAGEALLALHFEALLVWTAAANLRSGVELTDDDMARLTVALARMDTIVDEVTG